MPDAPRELQKIARLATHCSRLSFYTTGSRRSQGGCLLSWRPRPFHKELRIRSGHGAWECTHRRPLLRSGQAKERSSERYLDGSHGVEEQPNTRQETVKPQGRESDDRGSLSQRALISRAATPMTRSGPGREFCVRSRLGELPLCIREWSGCGAFDDRDLNAARNLRRYALDRASCPNRRLRRGRLWRRSYGQREASLAEAGISHVSFGRGWSNG